MTQLETALVAIVATALAGCSGIAMDGDCRYERIVTTTYQCEPGGHVEHRRVAPVEP